MYLIERYFDRDNDWVPLKMTRTANGKKVKVKRILGDWGSAAKLMQHYKHKNPLRKYRITELDFSD